MTFDASLKVKRGGGHVKGLVRHIARDADEADGFTFVHANENIDPDLTGLNWSFVNDGAGGFRRLRSFEGAPPSDELSNYLDTRLATVAATLRKDAVVMRPLILQLDPKWFEDHNPDWRRNGLNDEAQRYTEESLKWALEEFGHANVVGGSLHCDEVNPQLHVLVTPVTSDGRLSQKDFFKGPGDFKRQHKELRERMAAAGYDVEHKVTARSTEHLSSGEYQATADRAKKAAAVLAIAEQDGKKAWADRQAAKTELAAARADAESIRHQAHAEGHTKGYKEGERLGFDAGTRTAKQEIDRRVAEKVAHSLKRLREELERLEEERAIVQQHMTAYQEGLALVGERLNLMNTLINEINNGVRAVEPSVLEKITVTRDIERKRERALYDRHPELRPAERNGRSGNVYRGTQLEQ